MGPVVKTPPLKAGGVGSTPGQCSKIPHPSRYSQNLKSIWMTVCQNINEQNWCKKRENKKCYEKWKRLLNFTFKRKKDSKDTHVLRETLLRHGK